MIRISLAAALFAAASLPAVAGATLAAAPAAAVTQPTRAVTLDNSVLVERVETDASGKSRVTLLAPDKVVPGDRLLFVLSYHNRGTVPAANFVVTNPLPSAVRFASAADAGAEVSVDGGKSWGALASLRVRAGDVVRPATPDDVTHVRWAFAKPIPAGATGKLMFRGFVR